MDLESRAHAELRLWLRLLTCTQLIEKRVRLGLRIEFDTTLPRFDLMAQLDKNPNGLKMGELSKRLMVSGGNVTAITDQLVAEGSVQRVDVEGDRRAWKIQLTKSGKTYFHKMAKAHETWILQSLDGLGKKETQILYKLLAQVKQSALNSIEESNAHNLAEET
jgi:DNA-binding MarR family transcriptional regulator